jgi:hypothetical protein
VYNVAQIRTRPIFRSTDRKGEGSTRSSICYTVVWIDKALHLAHVITLYE